MEARMNWQIFKPSTWRRKLQKYNARPPRLPSPPLAVLVLRAILASGPECSTTQIRDYLASRGKPVSLGRLFVTLTMLEEDGEVTSEQRPGGAERNFYPKKVFWLTGHGLARARGENATIAE
jgi:hypothetical protein